MHLPCYGAFTSSFCAAQFVLTDCIYLWHFDILMVEALPGKILRISRTVEQGKCAKKSIKTCKESVVLVIRTIITLVLLLCFTSIARATQVVFLFRIIFYFVYQQNRYNII